MLMTPQQFELLVDLTRSHSDGHTTVALRQVLLEGMTPKNALELAEQEGRGVSRQTLNRALRRFRSVHAALIAAYGGAAGT